MVFQESDIHETRTKHENVFRNPKPDEDYGRARIPSCKQKYSVQRYIIQFARKSTISRNRISRRWLVCRKHIPARSATGCEYSGVCEPRTSSIDQKHQVSHFRVLRHPLLLASYPARRTICKERCWS